MHLVKKVILSEEELKKKREEDKLKINKYTSLYDRYKIFRSEKQYTVDSLNLCRQISDLNAESYSVWNFRRNALMHLASQMDNQDDVEKLYRQDFEQNTKMLPKWSKNYSIWTHREWLTDHFVMDWQKELEYCSMLLKEDGRNFHCWNYRRYVIEKGNITPGQEIQFSMELIQRNFSNYSAWHHRSINLIKIHQGNKQALIEEILREFEMVRSAWYTEPDDQCPWFYNLILINLLEHVQCPDLDEILEEQLSVCQDILTFESQGKWPLLTSLLISIKLKKPEDQLMSLVESLKMIDPMRVNYYASLAKKIKN